MKYSKLEIRNKFMKTKQNKTSKRTNITNNYLRRTEQLKFEMSK